MALLVEDYEKHIFKKRLYRITCWFRGYIYVN